MWEFHLETSSGKKGCRDEIFSAFMNFYIAKNIELGWLLMHRKPLYMISFAMHLLTATNNNNNNNNEIHRLTEDTPVAQEVWTKSRDGRSAAIIS